jgi:hypothetical protein
MSVKQSDYETLLAEYSNKNAAIALLRQHRDYLEMLPSLRRAEESVITIPLPVARVRSSKLPTAEGLAREYSIETIQIPCDLAILMCDPEWQIKMGVEIMVFIHRPHEDFSNLLSRWRQTQTSLALDYEWLMPTQHQHMLSEGTERVYPLFVVFAETPKRIKRGLQGAGLPFVVQTRKVLPEAKDREFLAAES